MFTFRGSVIVEIRGGRRPAHGRTDGIKQVVKEQFPNIKVTREQTGHWKRESLENSAPPTHLVVLGGGCHIGCELEPSLLTLRKMCILRASC